MSQMDSDNFVPIWAVACMEDIKALTADVDLIVDVLRGISAAALLFSGAQSFQWWQTGSYKMLCFSAK